MIAVYRYRCTCAARIDVRLSAGNRHSPQLVLLLLLQFVLIRIRDAEDVQEGQQLRAGFDELSRRRRGINYGRLLADRVCRGMMFSWVIGFRARLWIVMHSFIKQKFAMNIIMSQSLISIINRFYNFCTNALTTKSRLSKSIRHALLSPTYIYPQIQRSSRKPVGYEEKLASNSPRFRDSHQLGCPVCTCAPSSAPLT